MRLKSILKESKVAGIPFPFTATNQNGDGVVDARDIKAQKSRRAAVVKALQSKLPINKDGIVKDITGIHNTAVVAEITGGFDPPPTTTDNAPDEMGQDVKEQHMSKAELLSIHKKAGELYNMISEDEPIEGWMEEKITTCMNDINSIHNALSYEKSKPMSVGNGEGAPADLARPTS